MANGLHLEATDPLDLSTMLRGSLWKAMRVMKLSKLDGPPGSAGCPKGKTGVTLQVLDVRKFHRLKTRPSTTRWINWFRELGGFPASETEALGCDSSQTVGARFVAYDPDYDDKLSCTITNDTGMDLCVIQADDCHNGLQIMFVPDSPLNFETQHDE